MFNYYHPTFQFNDINLVGQHQIKLIIRLDSFNKPSQKIFFQSFKLARIHNANSLNQL